MLSSGRFFATAGADRKIKIWEVSKGTTAELKSTLTGSNAAVMSLDFDTTGTIILGASNDFASRVWTVEDCRLRHTLTGRLAGGLLGCVGSHDSVLKVTPGKYYQPSFWATPPGWSAGATTGP